MIIKFRIRLRLVEFSSTALGPGEGEKNNCLQKSTAQSPWTTNGMATARNVRTAGWIFFINFAHRVKAHNNICLVYTKFNALSYGYKLSFSGGPIALHGLVHFLNTTGPSLTKVVYAYFDRISYIPNPEGLKTILCHPFGLKTKLCHYPPDHGLTTLTTLNLNLIKNLTQT